MRHIQRLVLATALLGCAPQPTLTGTWTGGTVQAGSVVILRFLGSSTLELRDAEVTAAGDRSTCTTVTITQAYFEPVGASTLRLDITSIAQAPVGCYRPEVWRSLPILAPRQDWRYLEAEGSLSLYDASGALVGSFAR